MKYFQVSRSAEPKIIGIKDGTSQVQLHTINPINTDYKIFNEFFHGFNKSFFDNQEQIESLSPPLFEGSLRKNAKVTDLMRYGQTFHYLFYLYSEKYIEIIKTHNVGQYFLFPFKIESIESIYYLMFVNTISVSEIILNKSIFYTGHKILNNVKYYSITSLEEYFDTLKTSPLLTYEKIALHKDYYGKDIISVQNAGDYFYSEKLINFLLDCGITGLSISYKNSIELDFY